MSATHFHYVSGSKIALQQVGCNRTMVTTVSGRNPAFQTGTGAAQLEIAAALPDRTWEAIRKKIVKLRGPGFDVPETGQLENGETIADYLERNPEAAGAMPLLILTNSSPRLPQNKNHHCSGSLKRLNIATLSDWQFLTRLAV